MQALIDFAVVFPGDSPIDQVFLKGHPNMKRVPFCIYFGLLGQRLSFKDEEPC